MDDWVIYIDAAVAAAIAALQAQQPLPVRKRSAYEDHDLIFV